jgi:hypothetical protein
MIKRLRQILRRRRRPRQVRPATRCIYPSLERLEDRAMLSATFGHTPHGHGGPAFDARDGGGQRFANSGAYASDSQRGARFDSETYRGDRNFEPSFGGMYDRAPVRNQFSQKFTMDSYPRSWSSYSGWQQPMRSPAPVSYVEPPPVLDKPPVTRAATPVVESPVVKRNATPALDYSQPKREETVYSDPTVADLVAAFRELARRASQNSYSTGFDLNTDFIQYGSSSQTTTSRNQTLGSNDSVNLLPSATELLGFTSSITNLPSVTQLISRDTNVVGLLSTTARELVFQDYTARIGLSVPSVLYDRSPTAAIAAEGVQTDASDGFIQPNDAMTMDETARLNSLVEQEHEAVAGMLRSLHNLDTPLQASAPATPGSAIMSLQPEQTPVANAELQTEVALDEMPVGEVDGGMVLLQPTGVAADSVLDIPAVTTDRVERLAVHTGMETSVDVVQAVDIAVDDTFGSDTVQPSSSTSSSQENQNGLEPALQRESTSSNRAAVVVGATTLTGALVWMSRTITRKPKADRSAEKRHTRRGPSSR